MCRVELGPPRDPSTPPASFVEVTAEVAATATPEAGVLELIVGRATLRVHGRVDTGALTRVLDVLEARA